MPKHIKPRANMVRVAPDSRDGRKDYFIPADDARRMFKAGELWIDETLSKPGQPVYMPRER